MKTPKIPSTLLCVYRDTSKAELMEVLYQMCAVTADRGSYLVNAINVVRRSHGKRDVHADRWWVLDAQPAPGLARETMHVLARSAVKAKSQAEAGGATVYDVSPGREPSR